MGIIFQNGFGIGTVPNNTGAQSGQWYLGTGHFGYQPAWTFGTITWPMDNGNYGSSYGTNDPNEILNGNTAGIYINQYDAAGNDQVILLGSMVNNSGTIMFSQGPHYIIYGFEPGTFVDSFGMYNCLAWGPGGSTSPLTLISTSNTSFNGYSDGDNSGGPLTYVGSGIAPNNSELVTVTINVSPNQFTLTSDSFDSGQYFGSTCGSNTGQWNGSSGFTVSQVSDLYCGVYANVSGDTLTQIANAYTNAGATPGGSGYIFDVVWGPGSTVTNGVAKFIYTGGNQVYIASVDPADANYLNNDNNASNGTQLVGTFNFPATFTFKTPLDAKGGWC